jgi:hypothetical protein
MAATAMPPAAPSCPARRRARHGRSDEKRLASGEGNVVRSGAGALHDEGARLHGARADVSTQAT